MAFNFLNTLIQHLKQKFIKKEKKILLTPRDSENLQTNFIIIKK